MRNAEIIPRNDGPLGPFRFPPEFAESAAAVENSNSLLASWSVVLSYKWLLALVVLASTAAALLFAKLQTPMYRARTSVEIEPANEYFLNQRDIDPLAANTGESYLQTQIQVLQSESVIGRTLNQLGRTVPRVEGPLQKLFHTVRRTQAEPISREQSLKQIAKDLSIQPAHFGHVVEITLDSPDPTFAADFLNKLTNSFTEWNWDVRTQVAQATRERLDQQLRDAKRQLEGSEKTLQQYAQQSGLLLTTEKTTSAEDELHRLQQELANARAERILRESQREIAGKSSPESLPSVLDDNTLRDYQTKLLELRRHSAELRAIFTNNHPEVRKVEAQLRQVEQAAEAQRADVVNRIQNEYAAAARRENLLAAAVGAQTKLVSGESANSVRYNMMQREVETNRALYDTLLQRARSAGLTSAMEMLNIRVVDPAAVPSRPNQPEPLQTASLGALGGLVLGIGFILLREGANRRIRSPLDLRAQVSVAQLGVVPFIKTSYPRMLPRSRSGMPSLLDPKLRLWDGLEPSQKARLADSYRDTLTSLLRRRGGDSPRVIVVTSPTMGEGKTTVTYNLGLALAEVRERVLLIDADTRHPSLHRVCSAPNEAGLTDVLVGDREFSQSLLHRINPAAGRPRRKGSTDEVRGGLYLLPSGAEDESASALLYSNRLGALLNRLRGEFDAILIDTPPLLLLPDARVLGLNSDGVVMVFRSGHTTSLSAREAIARLESDDVPVLGSVLNAFNPCSFSYPYYGNYTAARRREA
jgi:polysaccharide biosynthesis transport protein